MLVEELCVGQQVSQREKLYINEVVDHIRSHYQGQIEVVGSRKDGHRISTHTYFAQCQFLSRKNFTKWQKFLDRIAREHDISAGEIKRVQDYLPPNTPPEVRAVLNSHHPDSDLDLAIFEPRGKIEPYFCDQELPNGSGLAVEIYEPGDTSYLTESIFNF